MGDVLNMSKCRSFIVMAERDKSRPYGSRNAIYDSCNTIYKYGNSHVNVMNKINKKAVLSMHTADICRRVVVCLQKMLIFAITRKMLIISAIALFNADKNKNQFQEPPFLAFNSYVSCS